MSGALGHVWHSYLVKGSRHMLKLKLVSSNALNNLSLSVLELKTQTNSSLLKNCLSYLEDTAVIVVKDHDSCHVWCSKLDGGNHALAFNAHLGNLDAVLPPWVGDPDVEVLVLLKDVIVLN